MYVVLVSVQYSIQAVWMSGCRSGIEHVLSASQLSSDVAKEGTPSLSPHPQPPTKKMLVFCRIWRVRSPGNRRQGREETRRIMEPLVTQKIPCPRLEAWCLRRRQRAVREGIRRGEGGILIWYRVETTISPWQLHNAPHPLCRKTHRKYLFSDCVLFVIELQCIYCLVCLCLCPSLCIASVQEKFIHECLITISKSL